MAPARRPVARSHRRTPRTPPTVEVGRPTARVEVVRSVSGEDPHAHIVCHACGRIQRVELSELDRHLLTELAALRPDGWDVDRIAFSLTGSCRRCREGPDIP